MAALRVAVVGAGWAGLAAAVEAARAGHRVVLSDMAAEPGGRARAVGEWDNGQHILIGAYRDTLALMRQVGADPERLLWRQPLALLRRDGRGLALPRAAPLPAFLCGVLGARDWAWRDRIALLRIAAGWARRGFAIDEDCSVAALCVRLPPTLRRDLIDPLCVAALNTPSARASGRVFLRVLHDALFSGRGGSDLLLPRAPLSALLPTPAQHWLAEHGAECRWRRRALAIEADGKGWRLDGERFDALILACTAVEAARLAIGIAPTWGLCAAALPHSAILSVVLHDPALHLPQVMTLLDAGPGAPAQFVFDLGRLGRAEGSHAFVVSDADAVLADGIAAAAQIVLQRARDAFAGAFAAADTLRHAVAERRATFVCTPGLQRPAMRIAPRLLAAGDYVAGPYPATLEGAVRSGLAAARALDRR